VGRRVQAIGLRAAGDDQRSRGGQAARDEEARQVDGVEGSLLLDDGLGAPPLLAPDVPPAGRPRQRMGGARRDFVATRGQRGRQLQRRLAGAELLLQGSVSQQQKADSATPFR
jgi:hypothetical protein